MAENPAERRTAAGQYTWLWMLLALVLVGAFLVWLAVESEPTTVAVVEETEEEVASTAQAVAASDFAVRPAAYEGQEIRLERVPVASRLGTQAFWLQLPNEVPYLVKLDPALAGGEVAVRSGDVVTVAGVVRPMTDSVLAAWREVGVLQDELQVEEARFATSFLEATQVRTQRPAPAQ